MGGVPLQQASLEIGITGYGCEAGRPEACGLAVASTATVALWAGGGEESIP